MLLGLATILAGSLGRNDPDISEPTFVGLILLWFFFALAHINHHIESGRIAEGQAKLRSYTELYEKTINGTFLLSSPEQHEIYKLQYASADYIPWFTTLLFAGLLGALETFVTIWLWLIPIIAQTNPDPRYADGYWDGARARPAAPQPRVLQMLPVPRR